MFVVRKTCCRKPNFVNFICTSIAARCDKNLSETAKNEGETSKAENKEEKKKFDDEAKAKAKEKLNALLKSMQDETDLSEKTTEKKTKPVNVTLGKRPTKNLRETPAPTKTSFESTLVKTAKEVAGKLGGDENQTVMDLLTSFDKIHHKKGRKKSFHTYFQDDEDEDECYEAVSEQRGVSSGMANMYPSFIPVPDELEFLGDVEEDKGISLKIWHELEKVELKYMASCPPKNYYDELIHWTEQGKIWHFPIDNDQGLDDEAKVDFSEHVFLEDHLEPWCPTRGPLRHFMELVLVGLSKNPYLTVEEKKEHIYWFRDYFEGKKKLLKELGALVSQKQIEEPKNENEAEEQS